MVRKRRITIYSIAMLAGLTGVLMWLFTEHETGHADEPASKQAIVAKRVTQNQLVTQWQNVFAKTDANVSIAVYDKTHDRTYTLVKNSKVPNYTASIVKVSILADLLYRHQLADTTLSSNEQTLATEMIENSNNDAANALLYENANDYSAPNLLFDELGMTNTEMDNDAWGGTATTATDQLKLLNALAYGQENILSANSRAYMLNLMQNVEADQRWGISAGTSANATVALKNGWLSDDDGWIVNSIGHVVDGQADYTIAVLTNGNATEDDGIALIEKLAKLTAAYLKDQAS